MTGSATKPEYPPLLKIGRHDLALEELEALCVAKFPSSSTRRQIMDGLREVISKLKSSGIECELWIDGSFLTEKIDADDCDLVLRCCGDFYDNATGDQQEAIDWVGSNLKASHRCDSYVFYEYDEGSPNYWIGEYMYCYWMRQWGFGRPKPSPNPPDLKGIAVVKLPLPQLVALPDPAAVETASDPAA